VFIETPIYNCQHKQIGYTTGEDNLQQLQNTYAVKKMSTYYFGNKNDTISWQYNFINNVPGEAYPVGKWAVSNIICGTVVFANSKGYVALYPKSDGSRIVNIYYKNK
jgi:hypothetical protein